MTHLFNTKFKKTFLAVALTALLAFIIVIPAQADPQKSVNIYFFYGDGCPHCGKEELFLDKLERDFPELTVNRYEVWYSQENQDLLSKLASQLDIKTSGVPITLINGEAVYGYLNAQTTGVEIKRLVQDCLASSCPDPVADVIADREPSTKGLTTVADDPSTPSARTIADALPENITIPWIKVQIKTENLSLPVLTIVIAALDGFNPCAMWVLLFLINLLLQMKDRRRMWILGTAFLITSAAVYFLFLAAWLNALLYVGFIIWIRVAIGLVALASGGYHLREYFTNKNAACKVTKPQRRQKIFGRLKEIVSRRSFWLALGGIILLAGAVNLVELICSAGLPAVYIQVLALTNLPRWQYYLYLLLYIFIFLIDDLIVLLIAMVTLKATGLTGKYSRWSSLVGGILMLIIGLLLLFKPEWLMFG